MSQSSKNPLDPRKIFEHAGKFQLAYEIFQRPEHMTFDLATKTADPCLVLSSLASELYLKCLLIMFGTPQRKFDRIHNLWTLFKMLPDQVQRRIYEIWDTDIWSLQKRNFLNFVQTRISKGPIPRHFSTLLKFGANTFLDLRYIYEKPTRDVKNLIVDFPKILRIVIIEIQPSWK